MVTGSIRAHTRTVPGAPPTAPADVLLADGSVGVIRPLRLTDRDGLLALHDEVGLESLRLRFFSASREAGPRLRRPPARPSTTAGSVLALGLWQHDAAGRAGHRRAVGRRGRGGLPGRRRAARPRRRHPAARAPRRRRPDRRRTTVHRRGAGRERRHAAGLPRRRLRGHPPPRPGRRHRRDGHPGLRERPPRRRQPRVAVRGRLADRPAATAARSPSSAHDATAPAWARPSSTRSCRAASSATSSSSTRRPRRSCGVPAYPSFAEAPGPVDLRHRGRAARRRCIACVEEAARRRRPGGGRHHLRLRRDGAGRTQRCSASCVRTAREHGIRRGRPELPRPARQPARRPALRDLRRRRPADRGSGDRLAVRRRRHRRDRPRPPARPRRRALRLARQQGRRLRQRPAGRLARRPARSRAAALYLESFGNPAKFARVARRFAERKPLLAVVGGRSGGGQRAGASHTAAAATAGRPASTRCSRRPA